MPPASQLCRSDPRFVGDPIDVVTGANTDAPVDLTQRGPILFQWVRYYDSARSHIHGSLGWGQSHDFDRTLTRDLDGLRYEDPTGRVVGFIDIDVGNRFVAGGLTLTRINEPTYLVTTPGQPDEEYRFTPTSNVARLARLIQGKNTIELRYTNGLLSEIIDSRGRLIRVTSDKGNRVLRLEVIDPKNNLPILALLTYDYDPAGNLIRATDYLHHTLSFAYDAANRMTRRTDRVGYAFHFRYDDEGRCVHSRGDDGLFEVTLDYQPDAKTTFVRRGDGGQWIYFYNDAGTITQITDPYGNATQFIQDDAGRTVQEVDPLGNVTELHYNWLGQHDYRIDPNGHVLPTRAQDPDPPDPLAYQLPETPMEWEFGNLLSRDTITPPTKDDPVLCLFPASVYNAVLGMVNPGQPKPNMNGAPATEQLDEHDRPLEQTGPNFTERWQYDPYGNLIEHRDREGSVSRYVFGSWNSLKQEIDPLGHVTKYEHTTQGSVAKVVDPGGTVTEYGYDLCERLIEVRRQGKVRETYRRDKAGNIIGKKDAQGKSLVTWEIGPGNLDAVRVLASGERHEFAYDERGNILSAKAPSGAVTMTYDEDGKVLSDQRDGKGVVHDFEWATLLSTTYFDKFKVVYETDDNGDLLITDPLGGQHRFKRSPNGLIAKLFASGDRELCHFDSEGRCLHKAVVRASSGMKPRMRSYHYSQTGDLLTVNDTESGYTKYAYDQAHRLGKETIPGGETRYFGFDAAGNLMFQPGLADVAYDPGNRITRANGDLFAHNTRDHISVRMNGRSKTHYHYNDLDMLVRCDIDGAEWTATYDPLCRRVQKTWVGRTTTYYWDDFRLAAEVRNDDSVRIYIYADEVALVPFLFVEYADLEAEPSEGKLYYIFTNQVGVPIRVENDAGKSCWTARIDPFGYAHIGKGSTIEMPLRFPGHYFDPETGLHYNRFRYFSPELGRYLQSDPAGQDGGVNLYAYPVNPLIGVDIDGMKKPGSGSRKGSKSANPPIGPPAGCDTIPGAKEMSEKQIKAEMEKKAKEMVAAMEAARKAKPPQRTIKLPDGTEIKTSRTARGPCLAVVCDKETGKVYYAQNSNKDHELNPPLNQRTKELRDAAPPPKERKDGKAPPPQGSTRNDGTPGRHAEVLATNQALEDRKKKDPSAPPPETVPEDIKIHNVNTNKSKPEASTKPMPCCPNCTHITKGSTPLTGIRDK
jgi:RHS repeat-associated protein